MRVSGDFWVLTLLFIAVKSVPLSGPYDIEVSRFEKCDNVGTDEVNFHGKMSSKGNGIQVYSDDLNFKVPWDDKLLADVEVQQLKNGAYTPKFFTQKFKNCATMYKYGTDLWRSFFKAANYNFTQCPLPVGVYAVRDWPVHIEFNNLKTFIYGSYKMIVVFIREKKRVGCFMFFGNVVPKEE